MKYGSRAKMFASALLACLMQLIAFTAKGEGIKIPTIWPPRTLPQTPAQNGDGPSAWSDRIVEVKDADINPCPDRPNCYEVVFSLESKVANTNVWVDFTAYSEDNFPFFIGDSISFDSCQSYTNEIVVAVGPDGKSGKITFVWDAGRCGAAGSVHHAIIDARLPDEDVMVACRNGRFVGLRHSETKVVSFKSVPFAAPARRWLPPEPPADSDEIVSARRFGPAAAQTFEPSEYASRCPNSEDCLKLTIWTADGFDPNNPNRAVMFYIHGGSYVLGGMCDPLYDGSNIVSANPDVIVVSCDYRLCAFGYLDLSEVPGFTPEYAQAPNLGILDLQAGLRWVQQNIGYFGGDTNKVTIFGESAGGGSVSCLLQAKGSEGLFKRAIVMSGTYDLTDSPALYKGSNQAALLMAAAGASNLNELLACDTEAILKALSTPLTDQKLVGIKHIKPRESGTAVADMNNRPMCDDVRGIVPSDPFASFATNALAKDVDVMIGSTSEEINYWGYLMYDESCDDPPLGRYYDDFLDYGTKRVQSVFTQLGYGSEVLEFLRDVATTHPFDRDERFNLGGHYPEIWGLTELRSELAFRIPSIIMAEQHLKQVANFGGAGKTYMYYFCRPQANPDMPWIGACHASELTSVFRNIHLDVDGSNRVDLATRVSGAFVNFAKYGDPNGDPSAAPVADAEKDPEVEEWKTYDVTNRNTMVIGEIGSFTNSTMRLVSDPKRRQRELLEPGYLGYHAKIANGLEAPAGSEENPWQLGPKTNLTEIVAWTNGTTLAVVKGAVTNEYPLAAGQYIVAQEATLQKPKGAWNGRVEVDCLLFDPMSGSKPFGSNLKLGLTASVPVKRLHRRVLGQLDHEDLMVNLTGAPQFETLIWDAAMDGVQKEGDVGVVTATITPPSANPDCPVVVSNGTFVGVLDGATHVRSWKGIPYAQQPTGPRRWKKVGDPAADAWTYSAKWFGHAPIQTLSPDEPSALDQGEDCLVLNVWSSDDSSVPMKDRPVAVYIHGGGFMQGCTTDNLYDGRPIVEMNPDIVVVTINYRVSYLSFVDLTGVPGAEDYPDAHNLGILDQRQALKWVHDNIAAFGGDPEKVTIFGESAGGGSVAVHLASPKSAPYFKRVLQMSGALDMTMSESAYRNRNLTPSIRAEVARMRFKDASRSNEVDMAMLRSLTAAELRALVEAPIGDPESPEWEAPMGGLCGGDATISAAICSPMRDDDRGCVPYKPFEAFAVNGVANDKDYMVGTTGQESRHFVWQSSPDDPLLDFYSGFLYDHLRCDMYWVKTDENRAIISNYLKTAETELDEMDARYPDIWKLAALEDQLFMRLPAIKMADIHAGLPAKEGVKGKTFMYRFDKGVESADKPWTKACHGCELAYFFGNTGYTFEGPIDEGLATKVCTAFANFVRTGDPNDDGKTRGTVGGTEWTEYDAVNRQTMLFNNDCTLTLVNDPDKSAREQLMPLYDAYDEGHHGEAPSRRMSGIKYELTPLPPAGVASDPWQVGRTTSDNVIAYRDLKGKAFVEGTGAMRDFYAVDGGLWFGRETAEAVIGAGVTSVGSNAFSRCAGLKVVVSQSATPPTLGKDALPSVSQLETIYVPKACVETYKAAWPDYASVIQGVSEGSERLPWKIGKSTEDTVFAYTNGTGRLVILGEGSMKDFGDGAPWKSCVIHEIEIGFGPDKIGVTNIGANAFANLTDVTNLVFHCFKTPAFGAGAFDGLGGVTVKVPCGSSGEYEKKLEAAGLEDFTVIHPEPQWRDCRKIADYLYEIWYDGDYTDDECDLNGNPLGGGKASACSAVRNGIFYGRNLDLPYMAVPNIVAHFAATETRYESMSVMVPSFMTVDEDAGEILAEKYSEALNIAPSATMTGINEFGVTCNSNVMPISDGTNCVYQIFGEKVIPDMSPAGGTHPEYSASFNLNVGTSVQFVLDNATNAVDAIRKLNGRNVYGGLGTIDYIQLMIADPERTFVVEFLGPYMLVIGFGSEDTAEALEAEFADVAASAKVRFANNKQKPIMTNWWHFFDQYPDTVAFTNRQNHANGVERYRALDRYYDESATFEGMRELMKLVKFSNCGTLRPGVDEFYPFTDNNVPPRPSWQDFASDSNALAFASWFTNQYCETVFEKRERGDFKSNWITAHSVVIDMKNRLLDIVSWEEWDDPHRFYLVAPTMVTVTLPTGVQGFSYVVSNLTAGAEVSAKGEGEVGGAAYELPIGEKIAIYAVPAAGYVVSGTNPYVIRKVTADTTLEGVTLPTAVMPVAADTVVYGTIRTAEEGDPVAEAIVIKDGRYVYVGDTNGAAAFVEKGVAEVIDHRGKGMVMPGCTDGHAHYANTFAMGSMKGGILFAADDGKAAVLQKLSEATLKAKAAKKKSLCGFGWSYAILNNARPTLQELDDATHGVSTVILDSSGHHAFCNSECLRRCGIIDDKGNVLVREVDGGVLELKDHRPTGYVNERVTGYLTRKGGIDADELIDDEVAEDAIRKTQELLLSTGYTMTLDAWSNNLHPSRLYDAAKRLDASGDLKLVYPMTYEVEPWQTDISNEIDRLAAINETYGTDHVLPRYLKVFMDGVVETGTGATIKPYQKDGEDDFVYKSFWSVDRLADITTACNAKGLTVHTHTMGDAAIKETVDAYIRGGNGTQRNCLVHLRNVRKEDFKRIAENNIACVAGLTWHASDSGLEEYLSGILKEEYVRHAYPIRSFFDAGVKVSSHSDYAANGECPQDPFGMMQVAVTGMIPNPAQGDGPYDTSELISVAQAFQALTLNGAWQLGLENERGSIKVGKWADFVLANQDVFACTATDIGKTKVVSTWFEGEKVYEAPAGSGENPWAVGPDGHEGEITAWTNGTGTLVVEGKGTVAWAPWAENPAGITKLVKSEGVVNVEELVGSLPYLESVNGLASGEFMQAALGFVKASGFSAIEVKDEQALLDVVVARSASLDESAEWTPVSTNSVTVPAPGEQGFFIVVPASPSDWIAPVPMPPIPVR